MADDCACACHVGGAFRPACDVPGGCGHLHTTPAAKASTPKRAQMAPRTMAEFARADVEELRRRWPSQRVRVADPTGDPRPPLEGYPPELGYTRPRVKDEVGGVSPPWDARSDAGDWIQPGRAGWSESSRSTAMPATHDCGTPWAWTMERTTVTPWMPDPAAGPTRKVTDWKPDETAAYVQPARPFCPTCEPGRRQLTVSNEDDPRYGQPHVGSLLEVSGTTPVGESPAPGRVQVLDALWQAQRLVIEAASMLRRARGLGPLGISRDAMLKATNADVPLSDVLMVKAWASLRVELDVATPEAVDEAAKLIRRALQLVRQAEGDVERTAKIKAPCILCNRMSLRAHIDDPDRRRWYVQCHAAGCREAPGQCEKCDAGVLHPQRWPWSSWEALGVALGIDVLAALEGAA